MERMIRKMIVGYNRYVNENLPFIGAGIVLIAFVLIAMMML